MTLRMSEIERALEDLKERLGDSIDEGKEIKEKVEEGAQEGKVVDTVRLLEPLGKLVQKMEGKLSPVLQKELGEALVAGASVAAAFSTSSEVLKKVLSLLKFHYEEKEETIIEYISPPNWWGLGTGYEERIRVHQRVQEAAERHQEEFVSHNWERFTRASKAGEELDLAWKKFKKEEGEAAQVIEECLQALTEYRKLRRRIRNKLKGEFDDPNEAYDYVPKQKRKSKK